MLARACLLSNQQTNGRPSSSWTWGSGPVPARHQLWRLRTGRLSGSLALRSLHSPSGPMLAYLPAGAVALSAGFVQLVLENLGPVCRIFFRTFGCDHFAEQQRPDPHYAATALGASRKHGV